ncbi:MAG: RNA polymerase sigma factor [Lacibacter sp.]
MTNKEQEQEFIALMQQHQALLYKICRVYVTHEADREDLYQEMVIQLWKSYSGFRGDSKFSTWMYRIALNTAISSLRKKSRKISISYPETIPRIAEEGKDNSYEEQINTLYAAIAQLTELERAVVTLYLEDKSYEEMEEILGFSKGALRVKMNRIKQKLRKHTKASIHGT